MAEDRLISSNFVQSFFQTVKKIRKSISDSFGNRHFNDKDSRILAFYFSLLEEVEEALYLVNKDRYIALPLLARSVGELVIDISNILSIRDYHEQLLYYAFKKEIKISEYQFEHVRGLEHLNIPSKYWTKTKENIKYARKQLDKLEEKGITNGVGGIFKKFIDSELSEHKEFYVFLDILNQEIHTDVRLALERYASDDEMEYINKGKLNIDRKFSDSDIKVNLSILAFAVNKSTQEIIDYFSPKYSNVLTTYLQNIEDLFNEDSG